MKTFAVAIIFLIFLVCFSSLSNAQEKTEIDVFGFANYLREEGDYYRAIGEYKRYLYLYPQGSFVEEAYFSIADAYFRAGRWEEAISQADSFLKRYPESKRAVEMLYLKGKAEKNAKKTSEAIGTFDKIIASQNKEYKERAIFQKAFILLEKREWDKTREVLNQVSPQSYLHPSAIELSSKLTQINELPRKSPITAGFLAAVIPGSGHLYTERPRDAMVSFLLNASFVWGAIELYRHENYIAGGIVTFFEIGWYGGNIYSAVSSAHKYNRDREEEFIKGLKESFSLSFRWEKGKEYLILSAYF